MDHATSIRHTAGLYSRIGLRLYDTVVMRILAGVWGCTSTRFVGFYQQHLRPNHADVGVGTGYCIDRCEPGPTARLALIDLRRSCLEHTARRLRRFRPETFVRDAREPIQIDARRFDSIAMGGLLHSLPGGLRGNGRVFDSIAPIAAPGAVVFGYTLVSDGVDGSLRRRLVHRLLNGLGVIDNDEDRMVDLAAELGRRFTDCRLELAGNVAFFSAIVRDAPLFKHSLGDSL